MPSEDWYCQFDGKTDGPYSFDELVYLVRRNRLVLKSQVRRGEEGNWITADCIPDLFPRKPSSPTSPEETPKDDASEQIGSEQVELIGDELDAPDIPGTTPPPLPADSSPIGKSIAAGAIALLLLLLVLLPLLFWHGDGGKGTAKGTGGSESESGLGSGTSGDGGETATADSGGGTDPQNSEAAVARANSEGGDGSSISEKSVADEPVKPSGALERDPASETQTGQNSSPAEKEKTATTEKRKPIPTAMNAIAHDVKKQNTMPQASINQNAGKKGGAEGGPGQEGTFFGVKAKGRRFIYIVDCSSSMAGGRFARVCEELIHSVKYLTKKQSFYVFFFNQDSLPMFGQPQKKMLLATPKNIQRLENWVSTTHATGSTDPTIALAEGLEMKPDAVFLLTDGAIPGSIPDMLHNSNSRQVRPPSKSKQTKLLRKVIVPINTIGFENTSGETILKQIATENDGEYRFIPDAGPSPRRPPVVPRTPRLPFPQKHH